MKKIIGLLLFLLVGMLFGDEIDVTVSEGTQQSIIDTLYPEPASPEVDANVTIKAVFDKALNPMLVRQSVSLKKLTGEKSKGRFGFGKRKNGEDIKGMSRYDKDSLTLSFTPDHVLPVGFYEVSFKHLMRLRPGMRMKIDTISYRFYVPEVINGFKLPPKPNKKKNNETLLGIDFNHNGVRDDVERWICYTYRDKHPIHIDIAMQAARGYRLVLEHPERAREIRGRVNGALFCGWYYQHEAAEFGDRILVYERIDSPVKSKYFNTRVRSDIYRKYDLLLSGDSYDIPWADEMKPFCDFNTSKYDKE